MKWSAYLNRCAAFKPFRPHPPAASPRDVGAARSGVAGVSYSGDDNYLAFAVRSIRDAAEGLRADNDDAAARRELRERLQALEAWKIGAGPELPIIEDLIWHYRDALGLTEIPTNMYDPDYWKEKREDLERIFKREWP